MTAAAPSRPRARRAKRTAVPSLGSSMPPAEVLLPAWHAMWATAFLGYRAWAMLNPWSLVAPRTTDFGAHSVQQGNVQRDPWVMRARNTLSTAARPLGPTRIQHHENGCRGNSRWEPREETNPAWLESAARCKQCEKLNRVRAAA
jgi:hypothetical protein